ncbi:MAG TPA: hypothetical protein VN696_13685 [Pyrinomonadaceae bacterium]|nr:hypothetical protein [Pyrinomonadaceae bacterium]
MTNVRGVYKGALALVFAFSAGLIVSAQAQTVPRAAPPPPPPAASLPPASAPSALPPAAPTQTPAAAPQAPAADPKDVATMDSIVAAVYDVISGPAGQKRNWDRFRSLFVPGARLIPTGRNPQTGEVASRVRTPEEYIARSSPLLEQNGFFEREISRRTEKYGNIAHLFSTYESRHKADDEKPFARGINSIQLMNDGKRWWIVTIFWQGEDDKTPLPAEYLRTRN